MNPTGAGVRTPLYGMTTWSDQYTNRQLSLLAAFSDAVAATYRSLLLEGATSEWASAVAAMLGLAVGRLAANCSSQSRLRLSEKQQTKTESSFGRNDLPMMWDFSEVNVFGGSVGDWMAAALKGTKILNLVADGSGRGEVKRSDARVVRSSKPALLATDPPYVDAIGYADLSDYFYVWHRRVPGASPTGTRPWRHPKLGEMTAICTSMARDRRQRKSISSMGSLRPSETCRRRCPGFTMHCRIRVEGTEGSWVGADPLGVRSDFNDRFWT